MAKKAKRYSTKEITDIMQSLGAAGLMVTQKNDPASTTLSAPALHGPLQGNAAQFGLFTDPGARAQVLSTLVRPRNLTSILGVRPSQYTREEFEVMTGVTEGTGINATSFTGNPPVVGQLKKAKLRYVFGSYYIKTDLNAVPLLGQLRDRADVPREIMNAGPAGSPLIPDLLFRLTDTRSPLQMELFRIGVDLERTLEKVNITGDNSKASTATQLGHFTEYDGLDLLIKTGYTDIGGIAAPALDSVVISFAADVGSTIGGGDGRNVVQAVTDMVWGIRDRATEMGLEGVQSVFVMRKELFRSLVEQWSADYAIFRATSSAAGQPILREAVEMNQLRMQMLNGQYLLIDGVPEPVIFSEGVPQESLGSNLFKSDMYYVPVSWQGMPLLPLEFFPMSNEYATESAGFQGDDIGILNNGMYIVGYRSTGLAKEYHFGSRFRMILETPWLAGRVDDLEYTFRAPIRNADPADTWFYADGGVTFSS